MPFLKNAWYVAAWSNEVGDELLARTYLGMPVVLFRKEGGEVAALHDRCPHRFAPLSKGTLVDGALRCGYHGLSFDTEGNCVKNLFSAVTPSAAKVRVFPVVERDQAVWIWLGDPAKADTAGIPHIEHQSDPAWRSVFGYTHAKADYRLLSDNLMDLTHTALLHPSFGGLDYLPKCKSWEENDQIFGSFITERMPNFLGGEGFLHNNDEMRWIAPGTHILLSRITPLDAPPAEIRLPSAHLLTPETTTSTHYFWSSGLEADSPMSDDTIRAVLIQAFDFEDKPMVEGVQDRMAGEDLWDLNPVLLQQDAAAIRVRRKLAALIAAERELERSNQEQPVPREKNKTAEAV